jgi:hypothetical protein
MSASTGSSHTEKGKNDAMGHNRPSRSCFAPREIVVAHNRKLKAGAPVSRKFGLPVRSHRPLRRKCVLS